MEIRDALNGDPMPNIAIELTIPTEEVFVPAVHTNGSGIAEFAAPVQMGTKAKITASAARYEALEKELTFEDSHTFHYSMSPKIEVSSLRTRIFEHPEK